MASKLLLTLIWLCFIGFWLLWTGIKSLPYRKIVVHLRWLTWDLPGFRAIWEHIKPPSDEERIGKRPPSTFLLWLAGAYTAIFGIASARYENAAERLELRASSLISLIANEKIRAQSCSQVGKVQARKIPIQPKIENPISVYQSFFNVETYPEAIDMLKTAVESCKGDLRKANLRDAQLIRADLDFSNLEGADLSKANLLNARLVLSNLSNTKLQSANMAKALLFKANLSNSILWKANLWNASLFHTDLSEADLNQANLSWANLEGSNLSGANLSRVNMHKSSLVDVNLTGTDFTNANLAYSAISSKNWKNIKSIKGCNIYGIIISPNGFREWALSNGAIEEYVELQMPFETSNLSSSNLTFPSLKLQTKPIGLSK